jgi:hypothetical protein
LLPRPWRPGIRRIRRDARWLRRSFDASGLSVVREQGAGSDVHLFALRPRTSTI